MGKFRIDIENVLMNQIERSTWNKPSLEDIEMYHDGELVVIPSNIKEKWKYVGLSNEIFLLTIHDMIEEGEDIEKMFDN